MLTVREPTLLIAAFAALTLFIVCSFWISRIAQRIRVALETRHPDLLRQITPTDAAHWTEHWRWQGPVAVAWAFLPIAYGLDDVALERDVARFKIGWVFAVVTLVVAVVCFNFALG